MSGQSLAEKLAVCSWSLQPAGPDELIETVKQTGLGGIQLALDPVVTDPAWANIGEQLADAGLTIVSGMFGCKGENYATLDAIRETGGVVPDGTWEDNWTHIQKVVPAAKALGIKLVTFHAGFLPEEVTDPDYAKLTARLRQIAEAFAAEGIELAFETGQETAGTLKAFLDQLGASNVGVNFDPANMLLYGKGDPVEAVKVLMPYLKGVHVKDAVASDTPGQWGTEKPVGTGAVDWPAFLGTLVEANYVGPMSIEREGGDQRVAEVVTAREFVTKTLSSGSQA